MIRITGSTAFGLGARIEGFLPVPGGGTSLSAQTVRALVAEFGLLHFTAFPPESETYLAFAQIFGKPEEVFPVQHQVPGHPHIRLQSNIRGHGGNAGGQYWHADGSFAEVPSSVTLLLCDEAPESQGETLFADMRAAYDRLPVGTRRTVERRVGSYPCREIAARDMKRAVAMKTISLSEEEQQVQLSRMRDLTRPLVRTHPLSGRKALYLNEHWLHGVEDMPVAESVPLLETLYRTATDPSHVHRHRWARGDLLVWDNSLVMHKALPVGPGQRKITRRITIAGAE